MTPVLVATHTRGIFFGYIATPEDDKAPGIVTLTNARNAVHWTDSTHGWLALASTGPDSECRVGPPVPSLRLYGVSTVSECTPDAVAAWELEPWNDRPSA